MRTAACRRAATGIDACTVGSAQHVRRTPAPGNAPMQYGLRPGVKVLADTTPSAHDTAAQAPRAGDPHSKFRYPVPPRAPAALSHSGVILWPLRWRRINHAQLGPVTAATGTCCGGPLPGFKQQGHPSSSQQRPQSKCRNVSSR
jgi:hypothetical protein